MEENKIVIYKENEIVRITNAINITAKLLKINNVQKDGLNIVSTKETKYTMEDFQKLPRKVQLKIMGEFLKQKEEKKKT